MTSSFASRSACNFLTVHATFSNSCGCSCEGLQTGIGMSLSSSTPSGVGSSVQTCLYIHGLAHLHSCSHTSQQLWRWSWLVSCCHCTSALVVTYGVFLHSMADVSKRATRIAEWDCIAWDIVSACPNSCT